MKTMSLRLPDTLAKQLESEARRRRTSRAAVVTRAIRLYLRRNGAGAHQLSAYEAGEGVWGTVAGGPADLSSNPKYMEGFGQ